MSLAFLLIGCLLGAFVAWLWGRGRIHALDQALAAVVSQAERDLEHERALAEQRVSAVTAAQEQLSTAFRALSAEALEANTKQILELARAQLGSAHSAAKGELEQRQRAVEQLVKPISEQLGRVDQQLAALKQEGARSQGMLAAQLRGMAEGQDRLRSETGSLVTALRKPNVRGQWGQMQLRKVVELAGMVRHCDFSEQVSFSGADDVTLRPDMVINLPGSRHVLVDAKAPLQAILDAYEAPDEEQRVRAMADHARLLRRHVRQLSDKAYWAGIETTPDFVVLFLPGEHFYSAALEADPELIEDAMARHVLIATPTTLLALLHTVGYGWQQEKVAQSAQAISDLGRELHGRIARLSSLLATLGSRLNSTVKAYNDTVGSFETRVLPGARKFADHGAVAEGSELPDLDPVTLSARSLNLGSEDQHAALAAESREGNGAVVELGRRAG
ncbi:DNA recombination protein RmuC [Conexibacter sp. DBS9H8]|uniref:DNA recombination protein RmuC n=1 Tax=Conexibacter sp. DBS9H8 TaxID=2937801 RepID=UPI00200F4DA4|nr:DNA recombination protein RmuC [Conexibacter sp. DBS9H8]